jgi:hypothetical protein
MLKRGLTLIVLLGGLALPAAAVPMDLFFSGTYDYESSSAGPSTYAGVGDSYSLQMSFNTDDFAIASSSASSTDYSGQANWSGQIGSTIFTWTGETRFSVTDGTGGDWDSLVFYNNTLTPILGNTYDSLMGSFAAVGSTFSGTSLSNFSSLSSMSSHWTVLRDYARVGVLWGDGSIHYSQGSINGNTQSNSGVAYAVVGSVPESTLSSVLCLF